MQWNSSILCSFSNRYDKSLQKFKGITWWWWAPNLNYSHIDRKSICNTCTPQMCNEKTICSLWLLTLLNWFRQSKLVSNALPVKCRSEYSHHRVKCDFKRGMWFIRNIEGSMASTTTETHMNAIWMSLSSIAIAKILAFWLKSIFCHLSPLCDASALQFNGDGHQLVDVNQYEVVLHINVTSNWFFFSRCPVFISITFLRCRRVCLQIYDVPDDKTAYRHYTTHTFFSLRKYSEHFHLMVVGKVLFGIGNRIQSGDRLKSTKYSYLFGALYFASNRIIESCSGLWCLFPSFAVVCSVGLLKFKWSSCIKLDFLFTSQFSAKGLLWTDLFIFSVSRLHFHWGPSSHNEEDNF